MAPTEEVELKGTPAGNAACYPEGMAINLPTHLSDDELLAGTRRAADRERESRAQLRECVEEALARGLQVPASILELLAEDDER